MSTQSRAAAPRSGGGTFLAWNAVVEAKGTCPVRTRESTAWPSCLEGPADARLRPVHGRLGLRCGGPLQLRLVQNQPGCREDVRPPAREGRGHTSLNHRSRSRSTRPEVSHSDSKAQEARAGTLLAHCWQEGRAMPTQCPSGPRFHPCLSLLRGRRHLGRPLEIHGPVRLPRSAAVCRECLLPPGADRGDV